MYNSQDAPDGSMFLGPGLLDRCAGLFKAILIQGCGAEKSINEWRRIQPEASRNATWAWSYWPKWLADEPSPVHGDGSLGYVVVNCLKN